MVHLTWSKPQGPLCNRHCPAAADDVGDNDDDNGGGGFDDGDDVVRRGDDGLWTKKQACTLQSAQF